MTPENHVPERSKVIIDKAAKLGLPVGNDLLERSGHEIAVSIVLEDMPSKLEEIGATAAYAAVLPPDRALSGVNEISIVVDLPEASDPDNIKKLDTLVPENKLFTPRIGEGVDYGLNRVHGKNLQKALRERYGGAFVKIYPVPTLKS